MRPAALAADPLVPTVDSQRSLAPRHEASTGTKLSPLAAPAGPTGTKLSPHTQKRRFRPTFRTQGESFHAHANNKPRRENFVPHARPVPVQNSPGTQPSGPTRYKTLPARSPADPPGIKLSQLAPFAGPPGTKLSRHARNTPFRRILRQQGEFYTASTNTKPSRAKKSRANTPPHPSNVPSPNSACNSKTQVTQHPELTQTGMMLAGNCMRISVRPLDRRPSRHQRAARNTQDHSTATKLAQQPAFSGSPRKSSPNTAPPTALPRKSSPSTPKNADFGPFWVRRANFFALTPTPSRAGRTFSRTRHSTMATLKPTTPLRPKNASKTPVSHPRR